MIGGTISVLGSAGRLGAQNTGSSHLVDSVDRCAGRALRPHIVVHTALMSVLSCGTRNKISLETYNNLDPPSVA